MFGTGTAINGAAQPDRRWYRVDFSMFRDLAPGFHARVPLTTSIERMRHGLLATGYDDPDVRQFRYIRQRTLATLQEHSELSADLRWTAAASRSAHGSLVDGLPR